MRQIESNALTQSWNNWGRLDDGDGNDDDGDGDDGKQALHVSEQASAWQSCNMEVNKDFRADFMKVPLLQWGDGMNRAARPSGKKRVLHRGVCVCVCPPDAPHTHGQHRQNMQGKLVPLLESGVDVLI